MCGRFTLFEADTILSKEFGAPISFQLPPRYNIAPTQQILAVRQPTGKEVREAVLLRWGLIPHWAKDPSIGNRMINARAETVAEKPAFRSAFRSRRCLVPSSGFYEWNKGGGEETAVLHTPEGAQFIRLRRAMGTVAGSRRVTC